MPKVSHYNTVSHYNNFREIATEIYEMFVYKQTVTIEYVKK